MLTFAAAVFFLIVTPGPGVLSTAGVGSAFGARAGVRYVMGLFIGTNIVALGVISGVAALLLAWEPLRVALFLASTGYLLYLALRIATAGAKIAIIPAVREPGIRDGLALQAINPKAYAVNTAMFAGFGFLPDAPLLEAGVKLLIMNAIWLPLHFAWLGLGIWLRRLDLSGRVQRGINVAMALSMLLVVGLALFSLR
ncbi:LysE family translocator [Jannaschia donghaensis]|uniref:Leucine export protein LeuE n=1 Tax=Jannaschia donghaensis TaxID=420998 RepID=A0A0M6YL28_9RHOB|nr:LysE family transporter [Jannaschia donghaensis]CTQ50365.1 leucine export protein LeuE [Jannaschia donghaensis]